MRKIKSAHTAGKQEMEWKGLTSHTLYETSMAVRESIINTKPQQITEELKIVTLRQTNHILCILLSYI